MTTEERVASQRPTVSEVASAFVDGEVGVDQVAWIEANVGTDRELAADVEGFGRLKGLVGGLPVAAPSAGGWDAIGAGVRRGIAAEGRRAWAARISAVAAAVVLVAALALGAALVVGRSVPDEAPQARPAVLAPSSTRSGVPRSGTGAVAAARGIGSVGERVRVGPRYVHNTTSTTSTRPPATVLPSR